MMPLGLQSFVALNQAVQYNIGTPWEYIRLRNESDNEALVTFSGAGSSPLGAWVQDDFYVGRMFTGQVTVVPVATPAQPALQAGFVNGTAYAPGELKNPSSLMLVRLVGVSGTVTMTQSQTLYNNGFSAPTQVVNVGPLNEGTATWVQWNDGTLQIYLRTAPNTYTQIMQFKLSEPYAQIGAQGHDLQLWGHLVSQDVGTPTFTNLNANVANNSIVGDDTRGIVTFDVQTGPIAGGGVLFTLNFNRAYGATPVILLSNATNQSNSDYHYSSANTGSFSVEPSGSLPVAASYKIAYLVVG